MTVQVVNGCNCNRDDEYNQYRTQGAESVTNLASFADLGAVDDLGIFLPSTVALWLTLTFVSLSLLGPSNGWAC
jgi:hypothetical protein